MSDMGYPTERWETLNKEVNELQHAGKLGDGDRRFEEGVSTDDS